MKAHFKKEDVKQVHHCKKGTHELIQKMYLEQTGDTMYEAMRREVVQTALEMLDEQNDDMIRRVKNMMLLSMAYCGLSRKTAEKVLKCYDDTVQPMFENYCDADDLGRGVGDFGIQMKLEDKGFPFLKTKKEM